MLRGHRIVAVLRTETTAPLLPLCEALVAGGMTAIELTMTIPGALEALVKLRKHFGAKVIWGIGSITSPKQASAAVDAGAEFLVSPILWLPLLRIAHRAKRLAIPAGATPTEIHAAWSAGADYVKVFPAHLLGGVEYIKALRGPLPQLPLIPSGGVDESNIADYFRAGCPVVNVGSNLVRKELVAAWKFDPITALTKDLVAAANKAR